MSITQSPVLAPLKVLLAVPQWEVTPMSLILPASFAWKTTSTTQYSPVAAGKVRVISQAEGDSGARQSIRILKHEN